MELSVILLKKLVIFPSQEIKLDIKSELSKEIIISSSQNDNNKILVVPPINDTPNLPFIGVVSLIESKIILPNKNLRVVLKGIKRVEIVKYYNKEHEDILKATFKDIKPTTITLEEDIAIKRKLITSLNNYIEGNPSLSNAIVSSVSNTKDLNLLTDMIESFLPLDASKKQQYMIETNPLNRANNLLLDLNKEIKIIKVEQDIDDKVNENLQTSQKQFILKEKLREIKKELGEKSLKDEDVEKFNDTLNKLNLNERTARKLQDEIEKYSLASDNSPETTILRNYIDMLLSLPWNKSSKEITDINKVKKALDSTHYGLQEIKERVIEYVGVKKLNPTLCSPIICLIGPPGVGKTSIACSIASSLNREFIKISVGGLNDSTELIGSRRTYLGANPGKIIQGLKKCGTNNPVILIDEIDKMVKDYKGDPASTLLEILDPIQNENFVDNYIEEPFDLSHVFFILTANLEQDIPSTLLDRLEIINLNSYTEYEKVSIAKKYLIPNIYKEYGLDSKSKYFNDDIIKTIINNYTNESGVRELDRLLKKHLRKIILDESLDQSLENTLGKKKYHLEQIADYFEPGCANALAYTPLGGLVLKLETIKIPGTGKIIITGMTGQVLEESVSVALDFLKSNYSLNLTENDIHIHFLDSTSKKDGPSAGVAIALAIMSLYLDRPIGSDYAFTGELSLKGEILPVGGIKEKIIGAVNSGIKKIYIPESNLSDLELIPEKILSNVDIIGVKSYNQIYKDVFKL
jgi:ATP-dependent Lon protease